MANTANERAEARAKKDKPKEFPRYCEPTYTPPSGSVEDARQIMAEDMTRHLDYVRRYHAAKKKA